MKTSIVSEEMSDAVSVRVYSRMGFVYQLEMLTEGMIYWGNHLFYVCMGEITKIVKFG